MPVLVGHIAHGQSSSIGCIGRGLSHAKCVHARRANHLKAMRVRKVVTRSGRGIRGKFPSRKLGQQVYWESLLERDAILMFELHPLVLSYQEQPLVDTYYDEAGGVYQCYPDFLLQTVGGTEILVEVKRNADLARPSVKRKLGLIAAHFADQGRDYRVITESTIHREPLHSNLQRLWESARAFVISSIVHSGIDDLSAHHVYSVATLARIFGSEQAAFALIAMGRLRANLEEPLTSATSVWIPTNREAGDGSFSI